MTRFLSPCRVLDFTDHRGLLASQMLASLGAEATPVEPPTGSPARRVGPFDDQAAEGEASLHWAAYWAGHADGPPPVRQTAEEALDAPVDACTAAHRCDDVVAWLQADGIAAHRVATNHSG